MPASSRNQDEGSRGKGQLVGLSYGSGEAYCKDNIVETVHGVNEVARQKSQLPQRATAMQPSMRQRSLKDGIYIVAPSSESTKDSLGGIHSKTVGGSPVLIPKEQRRKESSSRIEAKKLPPPLKPERSLSKKGQGLTSAATQTGIRRSVSVRPGNHSSAPHQVASRAGSFSSLIVTSTAKSAQKIVTARENHETNRRFLSIPDMPLNESARTEPQGRDTIQISYARNTSKSNPAHGKEAIPQHGRLKSRRSTKGASTDISTVPLIEETRREMPTLYSHRPQFSTMQQHFSPKKVAKASTSAIPTQSTKLSNMPHEISHENAHIQIELTQLHLLLNSSAEVHKRWEQSAERCLQSRFELLCRKHAQHNDLAQAHRAFVNHRSIMAWCGEISAIEVTQRLQLLCHSIQEVSAELDSAGRHTHIICSFRQWFTKACHIRDSRNESTEDFGQDFEFVESIGHKWKVEVAALEIKLASYSRELRSLGKMQRGSNLAHLVLLLQSLADNLIDELATVRGIESDLMAQESLWTAAMIDNVISNVDEKAESLASASYQGIWHDTA